MNPLLRIANLEYNICGCPECGLSKCSRCEGMMSWVRESSPLVRCEECEMVADVDSGHCYLEMLPEPTECPLCNSIIVEDDTCACSFIGGSMNEHEANWELADLEAGLPSRA